MWDYATAALVVAVLLAYRADFQRYSIFTVGVFKRIDRSVAGAHECAALDCDADPDVTERREWFREIVVAGVPLVRYGGGVHHYCDRHVSFELRGELDEAPAPTTERLKVSIAEAAVTAITGPAAVDEAVKQDREHTNPYEDALAGVGSALSLAPIALLVLVTAVLLYPVQKLR